MATLAGRPLEWQPEDLCRALELTNQLPKDAARRKTPRWEVFSGRSPIGVEERAAFQARLQKNRAAHRRAEGIPAEVELGRRQRAQINRQAMRQALVALGYLTITKRRASLTLKSILAAKIS